MHQAKFVLTCILILTTQVSLNGQLEPSKSTSDHSIVDAAENKNWKHLTDNCRRETANQKQPDGTTALHWAAFHGNDAAAKLLLQFSAHPNEQNHYQVTPLSLAAERGHHEVVTTLIESGADIESARLGRERPLHMAARNGCPITVKQLINAGADLNAKEAGGQTALMWAAAAGNTDVVKALVEAGADTEIALKRSGFNAFFFAAREGQIEVIKFLLQNGTDVNAVMNTAKTGGRNPRNSMSAIMLAIESGHLDLAIMLLDAGADPNDQRSGFTPLHAISWIRKTKRGDDPDGDPPPRFAGDTTTLDLVKKLVESGADINCQIQQANSPGKAKLHPQGATPFLYAARTADLPLMKLMLELGADPKQTNVDGCNALMAAAGVGVVAVGEEPGTEREVCDAIQWLISQGVEVNARDANGETAMHGAAYRNFPKAVQLLADSNADPSIWNQRNRHGWTPYDIATGKRPGSVKPSPKTMKALELAVQSEN